MADICWAGIKSYINRQMIDQIFVVASLGIRTELYIRFHCPRDFNFVVFVKT